MRKQLPLERIVENYLCTTAWGKCATVGALRAGAKKLVRSHKLPARVMDAIRIESAKQMGKLASRPQSAGRPSGSERVESRDQLPIASGESHALENASC